MANRRNISLEEAVRRVLDDDDDDDVDDDGEREQDDETDNDYVESGDDGASEEEDHVSDGDEESDTVSLAGSDDSDQSDDEGAAAGDNTPVQMKAKDGMVWSSQPPPNRGRRRVQDIVREQSGITATARVTSILESFALFLTDEMIDIIVRETNREAQRVFADWNTAHHDQQKIWKVTTDNEIKAFVGLLLLAGVHRAKNEPVSELFSKHGRPIFSATMSQNRFKSLLRFLRFDNKNTRAERQQTDRMAAFRDIWVMFIARLKLFYKPGTDITVDEQLVPFHGRCSFKQYISNKPHKYGIKIWWACDAKTSYPLNGEVYTGRPPGASREVNQGSRVVKSMVSPWYKSGRNVTADNFFTGVELAGELLQNQLTYVGTIRSNKREVPTEMLKNRKREVNSTIFGFAGEQSLVSYVPKPGKAVLLLSTLHHDMTVTGDQKKPEAILHYNASKSGVDNLDHLVSNYTSRRKINRWPVVLFANMLDVSAVAAFIIYISNFAEWRAKQLRSRRRLFLVELGESLVQSHILDRIRNPRAVQKRARSSLSTLGYLNRTPTRGDQQPRQPKRKRCSLCPRTVDKKVQQVCDECGETVCNEHSQKQTLCDNCM